MALGETHVIALTKASLSAAGVDVAVLEAAAADTRGAVARSPNVLLVKNLPAGTCQKDLQARPESTSALLGSSSLAL